MRNLRLLPAHRPSRLVVVVAVALAGLLVAGCGDDGAGSGATSVSASSPSVAPLTTAPPPTSPPVSEPPPTAPPSTPPPVTPPVGTVPAGTAPSRWDVVLDAIGDEGEVTVELAVDAFSLGVAPLPGSDQRRRTDDVRVPDASTAVVWAIRHFAELTPEQQEAVGAALSPEPSAASLRAPSNGSTTADRASIGCYGQVIPTGDSPGAASLRSILDDVDAEIASRLGGSLHVTVPTYLILDHRDLGLGLAYTWADPGDCSGNGMSTCTIHMSAEAESSGATEIRAILAHEMMHCYQFQYLGMGANEMPAWVIEGVPAWVGEDIAGGSSISTSWWTRYLTTPTSSLYGRDYDAIGFYAHLDEVGIDPWTHILEIFDGFSNEPAFEGAGASSGAFLDSWPSSTFRRTDIGRAWDAVGPGITIDRATPAPLAVANNAVATAEVGKVSGGLYDVAIAADIVTFEFDGFARIGSEDGTDEVLTSGSTFCARAGGCVCPDGSSSPFEPIGAHLVLGLSNGTLPATLSIAGQELECEEDPVDPIVDPCLVGSWISTASYIDDQVTGAPVTELGGGAGIVLTISSSGAFTMDFDASTPSSTDLGDGMIMASRTRGVAHGHITATGGQVVLVDQDYRESLVTQFGTGGQIAGGTGIGAGSYSCTGGSMEMRSPFDLGETINAFHSA